MNESIRIQPYSSGYQSQAVDLILHIQQDEYGIPITKDDQPDLFRIESFYQQGTGNFWIAVLQDEVVGTIALLDIGNNQVALRKMFVAEPYRGKVHGTAGRLLQTAIAWAKKQGATDIYLGTTVQFVAAHRFYEKNEFVAVAVNELPAGFPIMQVDKKFYRLSLPKSLHQ